MADIAVVWDQQNARGDWSIAAGGVALGPDIESAVLVSLFTDRLASPDFVPTDGTADRRGWWGDTYQSVPIGSRLWQLDRAAKSAAASIPLQARGYCAEALQWLITADVAATVVVDTAWLSPTALGIRVQVTEPNGRLSNFRFSHAWEGV